MANNENVTAEKRRLYIKQRIAKAQGNAKTIGFFYFIALLAVTALACLPLITVEGATLGVLEFWKPVVAIATAEDILGAILSNIYALSIVLLYGVMLVILLINVLRAIGKLGWLFKSLASKLYGFNRNMYAMDDLGNIFSCSLSSVIGVHFLITLLAGGATLNLLAYVLLGVGVFFHFVCGMTAGNVSLFTTEGGIIEDKREVGNFVPFIRNLIQIAAVAACAYFFAQDLVIAQTVQNLQENGFGALLAEPMQLIVPAIHVFVAVWILAMLGYVLGNVEFDPDGAKAAGRKANIFWSLLLALFAGGAYVAAKLLTASEPNSVLLIVAGVALATFVIELVLRKYPRVKQTDPDEIDVDDYLMDND